MRKLIGPMLAALVLHAGLLVAYLAGFRGDLGALVCVAHERLGQEPYEAIHIGFDRAGYDGEFYYALARAPWSRHGKDIDLPVARQARILYPAISWLVSGGDALRLLWAMPLINLLAIAALAGVGALLADRHGLSPWWGVVLPLAVNAGMPLLRDLTDVFSSLAVGLLVAAWLLRWPSWTLGLAALAALLSRELNVVIVLVVLAVAWSARKQRSDSRPVACLLAALAVWAVWLGVLGVEYGRWPMIPAGGNLGPPLQGFLYRWEHLHDGSPHSAPLHLLCLLLLLGQIVLTLYLLVDGPRERVALLVALAGAGLVVMGGVILYGDKWSYTRVFAWLPLGLWIGCVQMRWRVPLVVLSLPALLPLAVVYRVWLQGG